MDIPIDVDNETNCWQYLQKVRWPDGVVCPHCGEIRKCYAFDPHYYKCAVCRKKFNVLKGTMFEGTKIPLLKWFTAIYMTLPKKQISSRKLSELIGVTQPVANLMQRKILGARPSILMQGDILSVKPPKPDFFWQPAYSDMDDGRGTPQDAYPFRLTIYSHTVALDLLSVLEAGHKETKQDSWQPAWQQLDKHRQERTGRNAYKQPLLFVFQMEWDRAGLLMSVLSHVELPMHLNLLGQQLRPQVLDFRRMPDNYRWAAYFKSGLNYSQLSATYGLSTRQIGKHLKTSIMRLAARNTFIGDWQSMLSFAVPGITNKTTAKMDDTLIFDAMSHVGIRRWFMNGSLTT